MYCSFWNNENQKSSIVEQLVTQKDKCKLSTIEIDNRNYEIYGSAISHPEIDYPRLADALGVPEKLLILSVPYPDWCGYTDREKAISDTVDEYIEFFQAIPVGKDLSDVMPHFLIWLMGEPRFGAARFSDELADLISATCAQLEAPCDFEQVILQLSECELLCENQYVELYDSDMNCAIRKSRVARMTEFMQCAIKSVLKDGYLDLAGIDDFLCMGLTLADDPDPYTVSEEIKTTLYTYMMNGGRSGQ